MGIIKSDCRRCGRRPLPDQWLEVLKADDMSPSTVMSVGVKVRKNDKRSSNRKATENTVSNGSIIHVAPNQFMMLTDGGKVVDYTAEPGYYQVDQSSLPSMFNGEFGETLKETFARIKYGGAVPSAQKVIFLNLQEIRDIPFGTTSPVNYFDNFYNAELYFRAHGYFSIKIVEPLKFYDQVVDKTAERMEIDTFKALYLSEFLGEFQAALNRMSADGIRASHVLSKTTELTKYMREIMDEDWRGLRGMEIQSVGLKSVTFDDDSKKLIQIRSEGAMLSDPSIREGYVQGAAAAALNRPVPTPPAPCKALWASVSVCRGPALPEMSRNNQKNIDAAQQSTPFAQNETEWKCACGQSNQGKFCSACGAAAQRAASKGWRCTCGKKMTATSVLPAAAKGRKSLFASIAVQQRRLALNSALNAASRLHRRQNERGRIQMPKLRRRHCF